MGQGLISAEVSPTADAGTVRTPSELSMVHTWCQIKTLQTSAKRDLILKDYCKRGRAYCNGEGPIIIGGGGYYNGSNGGKVQFYWVKGLLYWEKAPTMRSSL